jgi:putative ABC transport system permease protein
MSWKEILSAAQMAMTTIREHKLRSVLTVLGVIIGTGTVMAVGSIITGVDTAVTNITRSFGPETAFVFKFNLGFRGRITREEWMRKPLTWEQGQAIAERCPSVAHVAPYLFSPNVFGGGIDRARYKGDEMFQIDFAGTSESYVAGGSERMKFGRFFTDMEGRQKRPVIVIGEDVQKAWFPRTDPIGKWIEVNGRSFAIVGVLMRPAASFPGQEDTRFLVPYLTMRKMFPNAKEHMLVVVARHGRLAAALDETRAVLRQLRRVPYNKPDDFWISTGDQMLEDFHRITSMVALVMMILSSIGLLVGGIGVMNIMLVSVTERTREIGIRKAVGARRSDIVAQFLTEAVVLTGFGGGMGIIFGWAVSTLSRYIFPTLPTAVPIWAALLGLAVSVSVGLFFGVWPAIKAARLDPVVALRYE